MSQIVKSKDKLFQVVDAGPWHGKMEVKAVDVAVPCHRWSGHLIPLSLFAQAQSFCEWSYAETKSESMVNFFYHQELGWRFIVLPQQGYTNMSVKLLHDHPNRIPTYQEHLGDGWEPMGSLHHHCSSTAFQSHTDQSDEKTKEGLHITLGHIGAKEYSIDLRASFRQTMTPVVLSDWFEVPEEVAAILPTKFHGEFLETILQTPPKDRSFPDWWKVNLIKVEYQPPSIPGHHGYCGNGHGTTVYNYQSHYISQWDKDKFGKRIDALQAKWADCDLYSIYATLQELLFAEELIEDMVDCDFYVEDAIEFITEKIDTERSKNPNLPSAIEGNKDDAEDFITGSGKKLADMSDDEIEREIYGWQ